MKKLSKKTKIALLASLIIGLFGLVTAALYIELPYYVEIPGGVSPIAPALMVNGEMDNEEGSYQYSYVQLAPATGALIVYAWLTPFTDIHSTKDVTGGATDDEYNRINSFYMETSQNLAEYQALKLAGKDIKMDYLGVYVLQVMDHSTFKGVLKIADTVTAVNGKTFESSADLIKYVASLKLNSKVEVTYYSDGIEYTEAGKIIKLDNGKNGIGIGLTDHTTVESDYDVDFDLAGVGGPSAGLMFTLSIYTQVADPDLRGGLDIAGTGTIEQDGKVGDVGGVDKKVYAAAEQGMDIFFVPDNPVDKAILKKDPDAKSNYEEAKAAAKEIKTKMKIVPVKTAQDAIDYLEDLKSAS